MFVVISLFRSVLDSVGNLFDVEIEKKKQINPFVDNINIDEEKESEKNASDPHLQNFEMYIIEFLSNK
jgi:hypothetical protein